MLTVLHELTTLDSTAFFPLVLIDLPTGAALTVLFSGLTPQNRRKTRPKGRDLCKKVLPPTAEI